MRSEGNWARSKVFGLFVSGAEAIMAVTKVYLSLGKMSNGSANQNRGPRELLAATIFDSGSISA